MKSGRKLARTPSNATKLSYGRLWRLLCAARVKRKDDRQLAPARCLSERKPHSELSAVVRNTGTRHVCTLAAIRNRVAANRLTIKLLDFSAKNLHICANRILIILFFVLDSASRFTKPQAGSEGA